MSKGRSATSDEAERARIRAQRNLQELRVLASPPCTHMSGGRGAGKVGWRRTNAERRGGARRGPMRLGMPSLFFAVWKYSSVYCTSRVARTPERSEAEVMRRGGNQADGFPGLLQESDTFDTAPTVQHVRFGTWRATRGYTQDIQAASLCPWHQVSGGFESSLDHHGGHVAYAPPSPASSLPRRHCVKGRVSRRREVRVGYLE